MIQDSSGQEPDPGDDATGYRQGAAIVRRANPEQDRTDCARQRGERRDGMAFFVGVERGEVQIRTCHEFPPVLSAAGNVPRGASPVNEPFGQSAGLRNLRDMMLAMKTDSLPAEWTVRIEHFQALLDCAVENARAWDFDLPLDAGIERASTVFVELAAAFADVSQFDVDVAVDGAITVTTGNAAVSVSLTVSPDGKRTEAGTVNFQTKRVDWTESNPPMSRVIEEIRKAA